MADQTTVSAKSGPQLTGQAAPRDHGGGLDAAVARFGGQRDGWIDLSTGINPCPWPIERAAVSQGAWTALPDHAAAEALEAAARALWQVPDSMGVLAAPGASALIARIPGLVPGGMAQAKARAGRVHIAQPTYNEHAAAFRIHGWDVLPQEQGTVEARVIVHPNNPTGAWADPAALTGPSLLVIDESFCDIAPERSLLAHLPPKGGIILKSFGKFWGLAGLRLGFAIGDPALLAQLRDAMGPWPVSGPALAIGAAALADRDWADATRARLAADAVRLDGMMTGAGATVAGGTDLFRLYSVAHAVAWQERLARAHIWSRVFPYSETLIRLGLPAPDAWARIEAAL
jgi:cobalamin biosynthesis protein CobC